MAETVRAFFPGECPPRPSDLASHVSLVRWPNVFAQTGSVEAARALILNKIPQSGNTQTGEIGVTSPAQPAVRIVPVLTDEVTVAPSAVSEPSTVTRVTATTTPLPRLDRAKVTGPTQVGHQPLSLAFMESAGGRPINDPVEMTPVVIGNIKAIIANLAGDATPDTEKQLLQTQLVEQLQALGVLHSQLSDVLRDEDNAAAVDAYIAIDTLFQDLGTEAPSDLPAEDVPTQEEIETARQAETGEETDEIEPEATAAAESAGILEELKNLTTKELAGSLLEIFNAQGELDRTFPHPDADGITAEIRADLETETKANSTQMSQIIEELTRRHEGQVDGRLASVIFFSASEEGRALLLSLSDEQKQQLAEKIGVNKAAVEPGGEIFEDLFPDDEKGLKDLFNLGSITPDEIARPISMTSLYSRYTNSMDAILQMSAYLEQMAVDPTQQETIDELLEVWDENGEGLLPATIPGWDTDTKEIYELTEYGSAQLLLALSVYGQTGDFNQALQSITLYQNRAERQRQLDDALAEYEGSDRGFNARLRHQRFFAKEDAAERVQVAKRIQDELTGIDGLLAKTQENLLKLPMGAQERVTTAALVEQYMQQRQVLAAKLAEYIDPAGEESSEQQAETSQSNEITASDNAAQTPYQSADQYAHWYARQLQENLQRPGALAHALEARRKRRELEFLHAPVTQSNEPGQPVADDPQPQSQASVAPELIPPLAQALYEFLLTEKNLKVGTSFVNDIEGMWRMLNAQERKNFASAHKERWSGLDQTGKPVFFEE